MSSIDPIQQPIRTHANADGRVPATTDLWDKNAAIVDEQLKKTTAAQMRNGFLGAKLVQDLGNKRVHLEGASSAIVFQLINFTLFVQRQAEAIIDGVYARLPLIDTDHASVEGRAIASYIPAVLDQERQHLVVMRNRTRLDAQNWPEGVGDLAVIHGAAAVLDASLAPSAPVGSLPVALLKTKRLSSGMTTCEMLPLALAMAKPIVKHADLEGAGYHTHEAIDAHLDSRANPHQVTLTQAAAEGGQLGGASIAPEAIANEHIQMGTITEDRLAFAVTNNIGKVIMPHILGPEGVLGLSPVPGEEGHLQLPMDKEILLNGRILSPRSAVISDSQANAIQSYHRPMHDLFYPMDAETGDDLFGVWSDSVQYNQAQGYVKLAKSAVGLLASTVSFGSNRQRAVLSWTPSADNELGYIVRRFKNDVADGTLHANYTHELMGSDGVVAFYYKDKAMTQLAGVVHEPNLEFDWGKSVPAPIAYGQGTNQEYWQNEWAAKFVSYFEPPISGNYQFNVAANAGAAIDLKVYLVTNAGDVGIEASASGTGSFASPQDGFIAGSTYRIELTYQNTNAVNWVANSKTGQDSTLAVTWRYAASGTLSGAYAAIPVGTLKTHRRKGFYAHVYADAAFTDYRASLMDNQVFPAAASNPVRAANSANVGLVRAGIFSPGVAGDAQIKLDTTKTAKLFLDGVEIVATATGSVKTYTLNRLEAKDYVLRIETYGASGADEKLTWVPPGGSENDDLVDRVKPAVRHGLKADLYHMEPSWSGNANPFATMEALNHASVAVMRPTIANSTANAITLLADGGKVRWAMEWSGNLVIPVSGPYDFRLKATSMGHDVTMDWGDGEVPLTTATATVILTQGHRVRIHVRAWKKNLADAATFAVEWKKPSGAFEAIPLEALESDLFLVDAVALNETYKYVVESRDRFFFAPNITQIGETDNLLGLPEQVSNFRVTAENAGSINLAWNATTHATSGFNVVGTTAMNDYATTKNFQALTGSTALAATGLGYNEVYYFYIEPESLAGFGPRNFVKGTTLPEDPLSLMLDTATLNSLKVKWTAASTDSANTVANPFDYAVEWSTDPAYASVSSSDPVPNVGGAGAAHAYTISGLLEDTVYYVRIRSRNAAGYGAYSAMSASTLMSAISVSAVDEEY